MSTVVPVRLSWVDIVMDLGHLGSGAVGWRHIARTLHALTTISGCIARRTVSSSCSGTEHSRMEQVINEALFDIRLTTSVRGCFGLVTVVVVVAPLLDVLECEEPEEREEE